VFAWILATSLPLFLSASQPVIPHFDIAAECDQAIGLPSCVEREHAARGALEFWWRRVTDRTVKSACIADVEHEPGLRYNRLMACIAVRAHLPAVQLASIAR
jgi:hypothetical protein